MSEGHQLSERCGLGWNWRQVRVHQLVLGLDQEATHYERAEAKTVAGWEDEGRLGGVNSQVAVQPLLF